MRDKTDHGIYRAAIVGLGNIAWKYDVKKPAEVSCGPLTHAGAYDANDRVLLAAGCSPVEEDRRVFQHQYGVPVFEDIESLIRTTEPQIVSICSPTERHFEHALYCLDSGIPMIWLEKPPAGNLHEIDSLIERSERSGSRVLVNYQRRYCGVYNRLRDVLRQKKLGRTVSAYCTYSRGLKPNGSHVIDLLSFFSGDEGNILLEYVMNSTDADNPSFMLKLPDGTPAFVAGLPLPYHCIDVVFTCEKGRASIIHGGMEAEWEDVAEHELFPGFYRLKENPENPLLPAGFSESMDMALRDLILAHEENRTPLSSLYTARKSMAFMDKIIGMKSIPQ